MDNSMLNPALNRRTFLKGTSVGAAAIAADMALPFNAMATEQIPVKNTMQDNWVWSACTVNCGSRCALRLHVKNDEVYWVETDNTGNDEYGNHQVRACLRGRSIRRRMNHPDRLKYPMRRVGKRGEGKFKRITWDEAYQYLFIGPNSLPAPAWGSVYLDPEAVIFGNSLVELRTFLKTHQIAFSSKENEPEDHFGLMLMLAAYLAENKPELLKEFFAQHLLTWSDRYLQLLAEQTDYPFYQGLSLIAQQTLQRWKTELALTVPKVQLYF